MNKFEEFKIFAHEKPYLKDKVKNGETTWQELYEHYDIYGPDDDIFKEEIVEEVIEKEETEKSNKEGLASLFGVLQNIDPDKISEGLNGMKKILNVLAEVTAVDESPTLSKRKMSRPYARDDD